MGMHTNMGETLGEKAPFPYSQPARTHLVEKPAPVEVRAFPNLHAVAPPPQVTLETRVLTLETTVASLTERLAQEQERRLSTRLARGWARFRIWLEEILLRLKDE